MPLFPISFSASRKGIFLSIIALMFPSLIYPLTPDPKSRFPSEDQFSCFLLLLLTWYTFNPTAFLLSLTSPSLLLCNLYTSHLTIYISIYIYSNLSKASRHCFLNSSHHAVTYSFIIYRIIIFRVVFQETLKDIRGQSQWHLINWVSYSILGLGAMILFRPWDSGNHRITSGLYPAALRVHRMLSYNLTF